MIQRASSGYVSCAAGEVPLSWGRVEKTLAAGPPWCARQLDQQVHGSSGAQPPRSGPLANHRHHRSTGVEGSEGGDLREGAGGGRAGWAGRFVLHIAAHLRGCHHAPTWYVSIGMPCTAAPPNQQPCSLTCPHPTAATRLHGPVAAVQPGAVGEQRGDELHHGRVPASMAALGGGGGISMVVLARVIAHNLLRIR